MQTKTLFITSAFVLLSQALFAQEQASHSEKNAQPSELVAYLFSTYGADATEGILLKIHTFEVNANKKVLAPEAYRRQIEKLDSEILDCSDQQLIHELQLRKSRFVAITEIEKLIH